MKPLKPDQIKFLVLEGGGGKGFAFLGAIAELERRGVLVPGAGGRPIGIAGSSAGAISATLLAAGMTSNEIETLLQSHDFDSFFDAPDFANQLGADSYLNEVPFAPEWWSNNQQRLQTIIHWVDVLQRLKQAAKETSVSSLIRPTATIRKLLDYQQTAGAQASPDVLLAKVDALLQGLKPVLKEAAIFLGSSPQAYDEHIKMGALTRLLKQPASYIASLTTAGGLFPGLTARDWLDKLIAAAMAKATGSKAYEHRFATFRQFHDVFDIELAITGTNLATAKSEVFSVRTTPQVPVATAVRISMGLPFIFKPVRITFEDFKRMAHLHGTGTMPKEKLVGSWIDGGVLNNLPLRVFETPERPDAALHTLALRLDVEDLHIPQNYTSISGPTQRKTVTGFMSTAGALVGAFIGAGEAHITESWNTYDHAIQLPTTGLSTLKFKPEPQAAQASKISSRKKVADYFAGN